MNFQISQPGTLRFNVGGSSYRCRILTLTSKTPCGRLGRFAGLSHEERLLICNGYIKENEEYFFERSSKIFDIIFKYYIQGQLHRPIDMCEEEFITELKYWEIPEYQLSICCAHSLHLHNGYGLQLEDVTDVLEQGIEERETLTIFQKIQNFCEGDESVFSTIFIFISIAFVLASVLALILGSLRDLQVPYVRINKKQISVAFENIGNYEKITWEPHPIFTIIEYVCILWFTFEFILRLIVADSRLHFISSSQNVVDIVSICPFYLELVLEICGFDVTSLTDIRGIFLIVRIMRVLRVVRILKLGRYSSGMRTFASTLKASSKQLGMMGMVLLTAALFFSTLIYFVEKDEVNTLFTSIPQAYWFTIVTMSTCGYGDIYPKTTLGMIIATGAICCGVLVLALPITIIVDNFMKVTSDGSPNPLMGRKQSNSHLHNNVNGDKRQEIESKLKLAHEKQNKMSQKIET
uniref:BTB domain-containing protein n=1 Tax=Rhabditophanes sp. KR3021 TaxID=114890 RepID=A0AC35U5X6_9BILA